MSLFIKIEVAPELAKDAALAAKLAEVCPVNIFELDANEGIILVEANIDECTLCELCLGVGAPGQVQVLKLYDGGRPLERSA